MTTRPASDPDLESSGNPGGLEAVLRRDRSRMWVGMILFTGLCWVGLWGLVQGMSHPGSGHVPVWNPGDMLPIGSMWIVMMIAMMVPTFVPAVLVYSAHRRRSNPPHRPFGSAALYLLGYIILWSLVSLGYTLLHRVFVASGWMGGIMGSVDPLPGASLLLLAGVVQWMSIKLNCLRHCRNPVHHLETGGTNSLLGDVREGFEHGLYCVGSTWALMGLMFVVGVMSLPGMALIAAYILVEKTAPRGILISRLGGVVLVVWGVFRFLQSMA